MFGPSGSSKFQQEFGSPTVAVTGAAGFIGSHLAERLLQLGCSVIGIDDFDPWYDLSQKRNNLLDVVENPNFELVDRALDHETACAAFSRSSVVFHLAGRPGVQDSWGQGFVDSSRRNIELTQQVFETSVECDVSRVVYASSSSVYGSGATSLEIVPEPEPISPYGVSKLVGEQLAHVYRHQGLEIAFGPNTYRKDAIKSCKFIIDFLKVEATFWKKETFFRLHRIFDTILKKGNHFLTKNRFL